VNLATMFEKLGRREEAQEHYAAALSINPADSEARAALQRLENQSHPPSPADAGRPGAATRSPPDP
jgi:tetratricopeptide (TPR) repeat protein